MRLIFSLLVFLTASLTVFGQTARVQVIHNSPTPGSTSGPTVDIYVNGGLLPPLTAVPFRAATPFLDVPSDVALTVDVKVSPSTAADPAVFTANLPGLASGGKYVVMATGIVGNAAKPFGLVVNDKAKEAASASDLVNLSVIHGSPDAPAVDVAARGIGTLIADLQFNEIAAGLEVPAGKYYLDVKPAGSPLIVETFGADLSGLGGGAATVFASGLLASTPAFGLFAALPSGQVLQIPAERVAQLQVIHGATSVGAVDIYAGTDKLLSAFETYDATEYLFVPAETGIALAITAAGQPLNTAVWSATVTLPNGGVYQATALGNPADNTFQVALNANGRTVSSDPDKLELNFVHGVAGGPEVSVATLFSGETIDSELNFGEYSDYAKFEFDPAFPIEVPLVIENGFGKILAAFLVEVDDPSDVAGLAGTVVVVPGQNGLLDALAVSADGGETTLLDRLPLAYVQLIHNSPAGKVSVWLDGDPLIDTLDFRQATPFEAYVAGNALEFEIRTLDGVTTLGTFSPTLDEGKNYVVVVNGGAAGKPITFDVKADARDRASDPTKVDLLVHHGSPDAPNVDVYEFYDPNKLVANLGFQKFTDYLSVPAGIYDLAIEQANSVSTFAPHFRADLQNLAGGAATVFASGLYTSGSPAFGLFAALANGTVVELPRRLLPKSKSSTIRPAQRLICI